MKKILLGGMFIPLFAHAQWNVNLYGGFSNYFGDLQTQAYTTQQSHLAFGASGNRRGAEKRAGNFSE